MILSVESFQKTRTNGLNMIIISVWVSQFRSDCHKSNISYVSLVLLKASYPLQPEVYHLPFCTVVNCFFGKHYLSVLPPPS